MPPHVRPVGLKDAVLTTGRLGNPMLDMIHFAILREEDMRHWTGNEFHRDVVSDDPQKLLIVDSALCLRLQRGAVCGAGGVMAWERGRGGGGARARRALIVAFALTSLSPQSDTAQG